MEVIENLNLLFLACFKYILSSLSSLDVGLNVNNEQMSRMLACQFVNKQS